MKRKRGLAVVLAFAMMLGLVGGSGCRDGQKVTSKYEITMEYVPENHIIAGTEKVTFTNVTEGELDVLKFQLYPNAYRKDAVYKPVLAAQTEAAYYAGESYGEMVISSVNGALGWEVAGEDENILYVYLEKPLYPTESVVLDIAFVVRLAKVNHRTGVTAHTVNLGNVFPLLCGIKNGGFYETAYYADGDPFYSDCADFTVTIKAPKEYVVAASGEVQIQRVLESKKECTMTLANARDFAIVLSKEFQVLEKAVDGVTVRYYYYDAEYAQKGMEIACDAFAYFGKQFGAYPYESYALAQAGVCMESVEYPALCMIEEGLQEGEVARAIAQEVAQQWWYAVVGSDQIENAWQDEGLATYSAIAFLETDERYGLKRERMVAEALQSYREYYNVYGGVLGRTDTAMKRHLKDYVNEYEYDSLARDKAVVMFDTLRSSVGDKKFFEALKRYYQENAFALVDEGALIGAFERTGLDVHGFFDGFLSGKGIV